MNGSPCPGRPRALDARRMPPLAGRLGWLCLVLRVSDQVPVAHRIVADGELEHAVEDQSRLRDRRRLNHTVSGVRLRSNSVPAVTDVRLPQAAHLYRPSATAQPPCPHFGQAKPPGHRSQSR